MAPSLVRVEFTGRGGHGGGMPMSHRCALATRSPHAWCWQTSTGSAFGRHSLMNFSKSATEGDRK